MIELKNISTLNIIGFDNGKKNPTGLVRKIINLLKKIS